jgi:tripartite-type tricarboxylate transporter receptor subunit TctC
MSTNRFRSIAASGLALLAAPLLMPDTARAQAYPNRTVRLVVPFPAGGASDVAARLVGQRLSDFLGQTVLIDNRPGAGGIVGSESVVKSPADGYTLLIANFGLIAVAPHIPPGLAFDPIADLAPVTNVVAGPNFLVVHPSLPARSLQQLIGLAKSRPGAITAAITGAGQVSHLSVELFKMMARVDIALIPYKGQAAYYLDLIGGHVLMNISTVPELLPMVQSGKLRALAISSMKRAPVAPDVPTFDESGLKGYEVINWNGIFVPAKTPREVIARLNGDIVKVLQSSELRQRVEAQGNYLVGDSPEEFGAFTRAETQKWAKVVKAAGIKPQ